MMSLEDSKRKIKEKAQAVLKWFFLLYVIPTSFYGMYLSFNEFYFFDVHDSTPIKFKNGFIFSTTDPLNRTGNYNGIFYPDGNVAVKANVIRAEEYGDFVYGYRKESVTKPYFQSLEFYFICNVNEDCSKTQNYRWAEYKKTLEEKRLPHGKYRYLYGLKRLQVKEWLMVTLHLKDKIEVPGRKEAP